MGEAAAVREPVTVAEFLAFEGERDTTYELVDGRIVAMAAASPVHGAITANAGAVIAARLRDRAPCAAIVGGGVALDDKSWFVPDLVVTCTPLGSTRHVPDPVLIVEVLSESTVDHDLGHKVQRYITLPSVREIWLVDGTRRWVQVWRRAGEAWIVTLPLGGAARFASEVLGGAEIALDELYRNSGL